MASKIGLSYRREAAMARLHAATEAVAAHDVPADAYPTAGKDPDVLAVEQIEYVAGVLETVAQRLDAHVEEAGALQASLDAANKRIADLEEPAAPESKSEQPATDDPDKDGADDDGKPTSEKPKAKSEKPKR